MMISITVLTNLLLASATLAAPSFKDRAADRQSNNPQYLEALVNNSSLVRRDARLGNWAGAIYSNAPNTFNRVYGVIAIPTLIGSGSVSTWVGIDGSSCQNAILQAGIDVIRLGRDFPYTYKAWYHGYPDGIQDFPGTIDFHPYDVVKLTVIATNATSGTVMIENITTEQTVFQPIPSITNPLCQQDAEWVVQDRILGDGLANFGTIVFTDAYAEKGFGDHISAGNANVMDIKRGNDTLTSSSVGPDATVTIEWKPW